MIVLLRKYEVPILVITTIALTIFAVWHGYAVHLPDHFAQVFSQPQI